jgi:hypothetical protein
MAFKHQALIAFAMIYLLSGCSVIDIRRSIEGSAQAKIKSVGITSTLGNSFHGVLIGTTIFNNKDYIVDVSDWKIDDKAVEIAVSLLGRGGRRTAKPMATKFMPHDFKAMIEAGRQMGVDAVVVISPSRYDNQPHFAAGYGIHRRSIMGMSTDCIYSLFIVEVFDVASEKKLGWQWGFPPWQGIPCFGKDKNLAWKDDFE